MSPRKLVNAAAIAAVYTVLTVCFAPISSGLMQCRIAEALCVLPYFTVSAVPGLFIGCMLSNLLTGAPLPDVVFGSLATLLAAFCTLQLRTHASKYLAPLPSVLINAVVVGLLLTRVYGVAVPLWTVCLYVAAGQTLACYGLGIPLMSVLAPRAGALFGADEVAGRGGSLDGGAR